jgi:hypothetical protein
MRDDELILAIPGAGCCPFPPDPEWEDEHPERCGDLFIASSQTSRCSDQDVTVFAIKGMPA